MHSLQKFITGDLLILGVFLLISPWPQARDFTVRGAVVYGNGGLNSKLVFSASCLILSWKLTYSWSSDKMVACVTIICAVWVSWVNKLIQKLRRVWNRTKLIAIRWHGPAIMAWWNWQLVLDMEMSECYINLQDVVNLDFPQHLKKRQNPNYVCTLHHIEHSKIPFVCSCGLFFKC